MLDEGSLIKIGQKKYGDFYDGKASFPEFKNKIIRVVVVSVNVDGKEIMGINNRQYPKYKLDENGFMEESYLKDYAGLISSRIEEPKTRKDKNTIDGTALFKKRALERKHEWEPTHKEGVMIVNHVLK